MDKYDTDNTIAYKTSKVIAKRIHVKQGKCAVLNKLVNFLKRNTVSIITTNRGSNILSNTIFINNIIRFPIWSRVRIPLKVWMVILFLAYFSFLKEENGPMR
jgi:hypothetical protein